MNKQNSPIQLLQSLFEDTQPIMKLILLFILMGISMIITSFIGILIAMPFFSLSWTEIQATLEQGFDSDNIVLLKYLQGVQSIGMFILPAFLANYLLFSSEYGFLKVRKSNYSLLAGMILLTLILAGPLINQMISWNSSISFPDVMAEFEQKLIEMEGVRNELSERILAGTEVKVLLVNFVIVAILPAIGEEFFFRGVIQKILKSWIGNVHVAIIIASVIFSAFHMQFYGFVPRMLLGVYFGYLFFWTGNIWIAVIAHFLNNSIAILLFYLEQKGISVLPAWLGGEYLNQILPFLISMGFILIMIIYTRKLLGKQIIRDI